MSEKKIAQLLNFEFSYVEQELLEMAIIIGNMRAAIKERQIAAIENYGQQINDKQQIINKILGIKP